jgi:hypothetical protein
MGDYRLYCLDKKGRITERLDFVAQDDATAIQHARDKHPDADCEIWELGRKVAAVPSDGPVQLIEAIMGPGGS